MPLEHETRVPDPRSDPRAVSEQLSRSAEPPDDPPRPAEQPPSQKRAPMSDDDSTPPTNGIEVEVLATVDLGREIPGMQGRQLRMRMITIRPGGVFGPCTTTRADRERSTCYREPSPTTETAPPPSTVPAQAGPRTKTPCTGSRTPARSRPPRFPSTSSNPDHTHHPAATRASHLGVAAGRARPLLVYRRLDSVPGGLCSRPRQSARMDDHQLKANSPYRRATPGPPTPLIRVNPGHPQSPIHAQRTLETPHDMTFPSTQERVRSPSSAPHKHQLRGLIEQDGHGLTAATLVLPRPGDPRVHRVRRLLLDEYSQADRVSDGESVRRHDRGAKSPAANCSPRKIWTRYGSSRRTWKRGSATPASP